MSALRTSIEVSRARGFSRFVGRADEMAALEAALGRAIEGNGQVVGVVAHPGLGKSRLCFEFAERCRARGITVYEAHGVSHGKLIPFLPILELFRAFFRITEQDGSEAAREKIAGRMLLLDEGLNDALPLMFDFLGVPDPERPVPQMDPEARLRQLFGDRQAHRPGAEPPRAGGPPPRRPPLVRRRQRCRPGGPGRGRSRARARSSS